MTRKRIAAPILPVVMFLMAASVMPATAAAKDLDDALDNIVEKVQTYLSTHGDRTVSVGTFSGPPSSSAGIRIKAALTARLKKSDVQIGKLARLEIRGSFSSAADPTPTVQIKAEMVDQTGSTLGQFRERVSVDSVEDVVNLLGTTTDLAPNTSTANAAADAAQSRDETIQQRDKQLAADIAEPSFALVGTTAVAAADSSPYRVEILLRDGDSLTPVPVEDFAGFALVSLSKGQEYVVRLHNASAIDVGVKLTVDGVNTFEFSENAGFRNLGIWMVPAGQAGTVDGWHVTNNRSLKFLITDVPDSAIATLQQETTAIGTISASFFPAWTGDDIPEEELIGKAKGDIGTGLGAKVASAYESVARHFGKTLLAAVSVRYEKPDPPVDLPTEAAPN